MSSERNPLPIGSRGNPIIVYSEVSSYCTHKCFFCGQNWVNRHGFIKPEVNARVVELLKAFPEKHFRVYSHVVGEPLLYKGLEDRIRQIKLPNTEVWLCTNGVLLDEKRLDSIIATGLENIWFSFFGSNREDYAKYAGVDMYDKAKPNLERLITRLHEFRRARIVCFSEAAEDIREKVQGMKNVFFEVSRPIEPWDKEQPSKIRFICVSVHGEIAYDWKDSNFTNTPGNILTMSNEDVMDGYYKSWPVEEAEAV